MKKLMVLSMISLIGWPSLSHAYSTYSKSELIRMYQSGNMPSQASPVSKSQSVSFSSCKSSAKTILSQTSGYPMTILSDNSMVFSAKLWTNDSAIVVTCSNPDSKFVFTTSKYL